MRLTQTDYRFALLQNYRKARAKGHTPQQAYTLACGVTQPLPRTGVDFWLVGARAKAWHQHAPQQYPLRQAWQQCYRNARTVAHL